MKTILRCSHEHIAEISRIDNYYNARLNDERKKFNVAKSPDNWAEVEAGIEEERMKEFEFLRAMLVD